MKTPIYSLKGSELLPKKKLSGKGIDCTCMAHYSGECGCKADWSNNDSLNEAVTKIEKCVLVVDKIELWDTIQRICDLRAITLSRGNIAILRDELSSTLNQWLYIERFER